MSCAGGKPNFRLLDALVGWDAADAEHSNLTGFDDTAGICLALVVPHAVHPARVTPVLPPARLARGCGACEWFLVTPYPPESRLLRRDACETTWRRVGSSDAPAGGFQDPVAVAAWRRYVAASDRGANRVLVLAQSGGRIVAEIQTPAPGPIAFSPRGELLVTSADSPRIARYALDGSVRGYLGVPSRGQVNRIAVDRKNRVWIVTIEQGAWLLWLAGEDEEFRPAPVEQLEAAFPPTGLVTESSVGFCLDEPSRTGFANTTCFSWYGRPLDPGKVLPPRAPRRQTRGQLLTIALDSGIPRCRWHRVRLDADVPQGCLLEVAVASTEDRAIPSQGDPSRDPDWSAFPAGQPHPSDWTSAPAGALDFLIEQPPGRYLFLRMRFVGDGVSTPLVRRVHIDFPRITSLEYLPAVYRENHVAEDFTERFLSLFDSSIADLDRVIERYPALLDPVGVPEQLLPWLGGFFDIGFDPSWNADRRRRILQSAPELYRRRGTLAGLQLALQLVFGVRAAIQELNGTGPWGAIGNRKTIRSARCWKSDPPPSVRRTARLRGMCLFGKARVRFRLGSSPLCGAPLRSYGNPDQDPFTAGAFRFRVLIPPLPNDSKAGRGRLVNLIETQKPAHTVASVRVGGTGFVLGKWSAIGVDTGFVPLAPPILGSGGNVRLGRMSILWNAWRGLPGGVSVGQKSVVGIQTIAG